MRKLSLVASAFALALASSVEAMPPVSTQQSDQLVTQVRAGCGVGMVPRAGVCVPRGSVAAAAGYAYGTGAGPGYGYAYGAGPGYGYSPVLTPGYASRPGYGYGAGPGYGYGAGPGYGYGAGPGYAYSPVLTPGYASRPGPDYAYGSGYVAGPPHAPGGPVRIGNLCWSDKDAWANTGQGYWKAC